MIKQEQAGKGVEVVNDQQYENWRICRVFARSVSWPLAVKQIAVR